jgi:uncharacterized protein (TIGR03000 family)
LCVRVPHADAKVWIDTKETTATGTERNFASPPLTAGTYTYKVIARWGDTAESREVRGQPGEVLLADFTK